MKEKSSNQLGTVDELFLDPTFESDHKKLLLLFLGRAWSTSTEGKETQSYYYDCLTIVPESTSHARAAQAPNPAELLRREMAIWKQFLSHLNLLLSKIITDIETQVTSNQA